VRATVNHHCDTLSGGHCESALSEGHTESAPEGSFNLKNLVTVKFHQIHHPQKTCFQTALWLLSFISFVFLSGSFENFLTRSPKFDVFLGFKPEKNGALAGSRSTARSCQGSSRRRISRKFPHSFSSNSFLKLQLSRWKQLIITKKIVKKPKNYKLY
jgi:hypothetical protein